MIVAGFGFRACADAAALQAALEAALRTSGCPATALVALASADDKIDALLPLARERGLGLIGLTPATLEAETTLTRSPASLKARRTGSLSEASALAGARQLSGPARLLAPRVLSPCGMASCALALSPSPSGETR